MNYVKEVKLECSEVFDYITPLLMIFFFIIGFWVFNSKKKEQIFENNFKRKKLSAHCDNLQLFNLNPLVKDDCLFLFEN